MVTKCKTGKEKNRNGRCAKPEKDFFKKCKTGKEINRNGRCAKPPKEDVIPPGYIRSPITKRLVKKDGPTGRYLLALGPMPRGHKKLNPPEKLRLFQFRRYHKPNYYTGCRGKKMY